MIKTHTIGDTIQRARARFQYEQLIVSRCDIPSNVYYDEAAFDLYREYDSADSSPIKEVLRRNAREAGLSINPMKRTVADKAPTILDIGGGVGQYAADFSLFFNENATVIEPSLAWRLLFEESFYSEPDLFGIEFVQAAMPDFTSEILSRKGQYALIFANCSWGYLSDDKSVKTLNNCADVACGKGRMVIINTFPASRPTQEDFPPERTMDIVEASGQWNVERFSKLPYHIPNNPQARERGSELMVFEMSKI